MLTPVHSNHSPAGTAHVDEWHDTLTSPVNVPTVKNRESGEMAALQRRRQYDR
jgi:hypothetical protein